VSGITSKTTTSSGSSKSSNSSSSSNSSRSSNSNKTCRTTMIIVTAVAVIHCKSNVVVVYHIFFGIRRRRWGRFLCVVRINTIATLEIG